MRLLSRNLYYTSTRCLSKPITSSSYSRSSSSTTKPTISTENKILNTTSESIAEDSSSSTTSTAEASSSTTSIPPSDSLADSTSPKLSASAFLLAQAELEEAEETSQPPRKVPKISTIEEDPWTGDEPQDRAIRRILEDSYKPLKLKGYKRPLPILEPLPSSLFLKSTPPDKTQAKVESKKVSYPWETVFKAPDSYRPVSRSEIFLRNSYIASPTTSKSAVKAPKRIAQALERSRDYEAGLVNGIGIRINVVGEKEYDEADFANENVVKIDTEEGKERKHRSLVPEGYEEETNRQSNAKGNSGRGRTGGGFVEQKIEEAIRRGLFKNIEGRGKPMKRDEEEWNAFVSRDEFLINRIVKSQGAAPPWVDLQGELDIAVSAFRIDLRDSWKRRAIRVLSEGGVTRTSIGLLRNGWRDHEWEERERAYHEAAIKSINGIVRRYNGVAPYSVRRTPSSLKVELRACFDATAPTIERELQKRLNGAVDKLPIGKEKSNREIKGKVAEEEIKAEDDNFWKSFRNVVGEAFGLKRS